jgi:hypothetical protein
MFVSTKCFVLGSALFLAAGPAWTAEDTGTVAAPSTPHATVKCPGISGVPVTSDAEQVLPLRLVGTLACGESVSVLSDTEGYTAHIQTADGRDGYVALMYLVIGERAAVAPDQHTPSATPVNGVVRWHAGAPGCDAFMTQGRLVESITANGITVQVSLQDTGWKYSASIAVSNQGNGTVEVIPGIVTLDELQPNLKVLTATEPEKLAHNRTHQVFWSLANAQPSASAVEAHSANSSALSALSYRTNPAPDYLSPHLVPTSAHPGAFGRTESVDVRAIALKNVSLPTGQITAGVMWFNRDAGARELSLRIPAGDLVFDFPLSFEPKK